MSKMRLSDHTVPPSSHFKGVVSLVNGPMEDPIHDSPNRSLTNQDHAVLSPIIPSGGDEIDLLGGVGTMTNPQDAVSDHVHDGRTVVAEQHEALVPSSSSRTGLHPLSPLSVGAGAVSTPLMTNVRSRKGNQGLHGGEGSHGKRRRKKRQQGMNADEPNHSAKWRILCCRDRNVRRNIQSCMNFVARLLLWCTVVISVSLVVWYSYELKNNGYVLPF
jgi:hypothetical protein